MAYLPGLPAYDQPPSYGTATENQREKALDAIKAKAYSKLVGKNNLLDLYLAEEIKKLLN